MNTFSLTNSPIRKISSFRLRMTTRSQKGKAVAELVSGDFESSSAENIQTENYVAGRCILPKIQSENLDEIKSSLRKKIMSDLAKILAEYQM